MRVKVIASNKIPARFAIGGKFAKLLKTMAATGEGEALKITHGSEAEAIGNQAQMLIAFKRAGMPITTSRDKQHVYVQRRSHVGA